MRLTPVWLAFLSFSAFSSCSIFSKAFPISKLPSDMSCFNKCNFFIAFSQALLAKCRANFRRIGKCTAWSSASLWAVFTRYYSSWERTPWGPLKYCRFSLFGFALCTSLQTSLALAPTSHILASRKPRLVLLPVYPKPLLILFNSL